MIHLFLAVVALALAYTLWRDWSKPNVTVLAYSASPEQLRTQLAEQARQHDWTRCELGPEQCSSCYHFFNDPCPPGEECSECAQ